MLVEKTFLGRSRHAALLAQIERFGYTGGLSFVIDYGLLVALTELAGLNYLWSATISFSAAFVVNYLLSVYWVYDVTRKPQLNLFKTSVPFLILALCGLGINNLLMYAGVEFAQIHYALCKIFATGVVMIFNFVTRKILLEGGGGFKTDIFH